MRRLSFVIGAVLIGTAFFVTRPAFAFTLRPGEPIPICTQCPVCSAEDAAALREQCDLVVGAIGIVRPVTPNDSVEGLPACPASATACEDCGVGIPSTWLCLLNLFVQ
jgi:hypothetical protein